MNQTKEETTLVSTTTDHSVIDVRTLTVLDCAASGYTSAHLHTSLKTCTNPEMTNLKHTLFLQEQLKDRTYTDKQTR